MLMPIIGRISTLLFGMAILIAGHGLQLAYVPLRAELFGWSNLAAGMLGSVYFSGFLLGCFLVPYLVSRSGHIRSFAALSSLGTASILALALSENYVFWLALRFLVGVSVAGLYLVIESWFNELVVEDNRGTVLAFYTMIALFAMASGQLLLKVSPIEDGSLLILAAMLFVAAAIPICLTRTAQPSQIPSASFSPFLVLRTSTAATIGALISGLVTGSYYGLAPAYGLQIGLAIDEISTMMALGIIGGALTQLPLGRLSDKMDRRIVIFSIMIVGALVSLLMLFSGVEGVPYLMVFYGGCAMPLYALSLAHASDNSASSSFLEIGTGLMIVHALGAIVGPLLVAQAMSLIGAHAFFIVNGLILMLGGSAIFVLTKIRGSAREHFTEFEMATTVSAQGAITLDPRVESEFDEADLGEVPQEVPQEVP